jgi:hypothetical protein
MRLGDIGVPDAVDQDEGDPTGFFTAIDPAVIGTPLDTETGLPQFVEDSNRRAVLDDDRAALLVVAGDYPAD